MAACFYNVASWELFHQLWNMHKCVYDCLILLNHYNHSLCIFIISLLGSTCPTFEQRDLVQQVVTASSDDFSVIAVTKPRVPAGPTEIIDHVCGPGNWMQIVLLNLSNPSHRCPSALTEVTTPAGRGCTRPGASSGSCSSTIYSTLGIQYNRVCGRSIGYQNGTTEAFLINSPIPQTIDTFYVDGLSVTHGSPRQHVWSFASGLTESPESGINGCFCGDPSITPGAPPPPFVGNNYFCESGNLGPPASGLFAEDPLWNGMNCPTNNCCEFNNPPWFNAELSALTTDDIEVRLCCSQDTADENIVLQLLELYVSN